MAFAAAVGYFSMPAAHCSRGSSYCSFAETAAAKHAQEVIDLRSECRLLRGSARGVNAAPSVASDGRTEAALGSEPPLPCTSSVQCSVVSSGELRRTLSRMFAALRMPHGSVSFLHSGRPAFSTTHVTARIPSGSATWDKEGNQELGISDLSDRETAFVKDGLSKVARTTEGVSSEAQEILTQLDGLCCFMEYVTGRAEWLLKEWRSLQGEYLWEGLCSGRAGHGGNL